MDTNTIGSNLHNAQTEMSLNTLCAFSKVLSFSKFFLRAKGSSHMYVDKMLNNWLEIWKQKWHGKRLLSQNHLVSGAQHW